MTPDLDRINRLLTLPPALLALSLSVYHRNFPPLRAHIDNLITQNKLEHLFRRTERGTLFSA